MISMGRLVYFLKLKYETFDDFKVFKGMVESKVVNILTCGDLIEDENMTPKSLQHIVNNLESRDNSHRGTHHNIIV